MPPNPPTKPDGRFLIARVRRAKTKSGKEVVHLFSSDTRLEFPVLVLFDLSALQVVGIDPNALGATDLYTRFWAYYTESDKETSKGNPYRDVLYLQPIDSPVTSSSIDGDEILHELQTIRALLQVLTDAKLREHQPHSDPAPHPSHGSTASGEPDDTSQKGETLATRPAEQPTRAVTTCDGTLDDLYDDVDLGFNQDTNDLPAARIQAPPPTSNRDARLEFYAIATQAMKAKTIKPHDVNDLARTGTTNGWPEALDQLRRTIAN